MKYRTRETNSKYNDYTEDELVEAYADNLISDDDWDIMWENRRISSNVYSMGMQELVYREKVREQQLNKSPKNDTISKLNYEVRGFKSGFLEDTVEDDLFTGYMEGGITYPELDVQYRNNMISQQFLDHCVKSRQDYLVQKQFKNYINKSPVWKTTQPIHSAENIRRAKNLRVLKTNHGDDHFEIGEPGKVPSVITLPPVSNRTEQWLELLHRKNMTEDEWTQLYKGGWIDELTYEDGLDELGIDSEGNDIGLVFNTTYKGLKDYDTEPVFTKPLPPTIEWQELGDTGTVKTLVYGTIRKPRGK